MIAAAMRQGLEDKCEVVSQGWFTSPNACCCTVGHVFDGSVAGQSIADVMTPVVWSAVVASHLCLHRPWLQILHLKEDVIVDDLSNDPIWVHWHISLLFLFELTVLGMCVNAFLHWQYSGVSTSSECHGINSVLFCVDQLLALCGYRLLA